MATTSPDLGQVDLNLLYTLHLVHELGSVGAAARRLGRSQPAISVRLRQLEAELGIALFEPAGRRIALTLAGRAVHEEAQAIVQRAQHLLDRARQSSAEPTGTLRIGTLPTVSAFLLGPILAELLADHPGVRVEIEPGLVRGQLERLRAGQLDMVISVGPRPSAPLKVIPLGGVRPVLAFTQALLPTSPRVVTLRHLRGLPLVAFGKTDDAFFDQVWTFVERGGLVGNIRLRVGHIQTLKAFVHLGVGAAMVPDYTAREPGLICRPIDGLGFAQPLWVAIRPSGRQVPLIQRLVEQLPRAIARSLPRSAAR